MKANERMLKEDAERLARSMQEDDAMIEIRDIAVDPDVGGYVVVAYDRRTGEEFVIDHYDSWEARRTEQEKTRSAKIRFSKVHTRHGKKNATLSGEWMRVQNEDIPDEISCAIDRGDIPGETLTDFEPSLSEIDLLEPGNGKPEDYWVAGKFLLLVDSRGLKVWKLIERLANFTLKDQVDYVQEWRRLGFEINPEQRAPFLDSESELAEAEILEEVRESLLDIAREGYDAIVVDGGTSVGFYAWVIAGTLGLSVLISFVREKASANFGSASLSYVELLPYKEVEESLLPSS
ncbi:MAG: hypothetical protein PHP64_01595 [Actinomycetota bacterium]|nr:hypothetical protein [Actinomycetota bacterium]